MMRRLAALFILVLATPLLASDVYVNGVKIFRLQNVTLENCTVSFDAMGNVQIAAPGYEIRVQQPPAQAAPQAPTYGGQPGYAPQPPPQAGYAPPPAPTGYPMTPAPPAYGAPLGAPAVGAMAPAAPPVAAPPVRGGRVGFALTTTGQQTITLPLNFDLVVNGTPVRAFTAADAGLTLDLSSYLQKGSNTIRLGIEYDSMYSGVQPTVADVFTVRIQVGRFHGQAFTSERTLVEFKRDGTQMLGTIKEFQLQL
jgi:hypothetical protein